MNRLSQDALKAMDQLISSTGKEIPAATPAQGPTDLTIAFAVFDDFDGAFFTLHSLMLHHPEVMERAELLILDNHPEGLGAHELAAYATSSRHNVRYVPYTHSRSTAVRDVIFREAAGDVVVVLDCHVLLAPGALAAVLAYYDEHPGSPDLVQGPMLSGDATHLAATHMAPTWNGGMFGTWGIDERGEDVDGDAFDIPSQGLAAFACRRDAWPGINPLFRGFGGEEGYVHEKVRQRGGRTLCLPAFRWVHRFERPRGIPYTIRWVDRVHNYLVGWSEIGYDLDSIRDHFGDLLYPDQYNTVFAAAERLIQSPGRAFGNVCVISDPVRVAPWRAALGESEASGLDVSRVVVEPSENDTGEKGPNKLIRGIRSAVELATYRAWPSILLVDESAKLDAALPYRVSGAIASVTDDVITVTSVDGQLGAVVIASHAYSRLLAIEDDITTDSLGGTAVITAHPVAPARTSHTVSSGLDHVCLLGPDLRDTSAVRAFELADSLGATSAMTAAFDDTNHPTRGYAKSWRRLIAELSIERPQQTVLIMASHAKLHDAASDILPRALAEAEHLNAAVMMLSASESDDLPPCDGLVHVRGPGYVYQDTAMVIMPGVAEQLGRLVPDPREDAAAFEKWFLLHGSVANFLSTVTEITVVPVWPSLAATNEHIQLDASLGRRSRLYRRS